MATNNSSSVSKRSVEKFYYPDEPSFFRHFVSRFQRRSPLINRGYLVRMEVVDTIVRNFLAAAPLTEGSAVTKVVANLGCGYDVLPWQCLARRPDLCRQAKFIDVDFPALMLRKRRIVLDEPQLRLPLEPLQSTGGDGDSPVVLQSAQYCQIGCDLRELSVLADSLAAVVDKSQCRFLFVAEVSITYMDTADADSLIHWCSSYGQAEFCLLEQILPAGPDHPFASTMLSHFNKLNSPLRSVETYSDLAKQEQRFRARGWESVRGWTLWDAWVDPYFFSADSRRALDEVEVFDEWEEFALFASHYCVIHAANHRWDVSETVIENGGNDVVPSAHNPIPCFPVNMQRNDPSLVPRPGPRRLAAAVEVLDDLGQPIILHCFGVGSSGRSVSCDVYAALGSAIDQWSWGVGDAPSARLCYSWTDLGRGEFLLAGGRQSPSDLRCDSWLFHSATRSWERAADLPLPLYRHSVCRLGRSPLILLIGGRVSHRDVFASALLYHPARGWVACKVLGHWVPVFGAVLGYSGRNGASEFHGLLTGGMSQSGEVVEQVLAWDLQLAALSRPVLTFKPCSVTTHAGTAAGSLTETRLLSRFGASYAVQGSLVIIIGGVVRGRLLQPDEEIVLCQLSAGQCELLARLSTGTSPNSSSLHERPIFIGSSAVWTATGDIGVLGGGATCFSMGTFWTRGALTFTVPREVLFARSQLESSVAVAMAYQKTMPLSPSPAIAGFSVAPPKSEGTVQSPNPLQIPRVRLQAETDLDELIRGGRPVILEHCQLGPSLQRWTPDYLAQCVGFDRKVTVHDSAGEKMDFNPKNFRYESVKFGDFIKRAERGERVYLRALSTEAPIEKPARLDQDYPELAQEFWLPQNTKSVSDKIFSSVLRISGKVTMWLHYDVMANIYCQIVGSRRLVLFPPSDIKTLSFAPGATTSSLDVFTTGSDVAHIENSRAHVADLGPGDVLFLPPFWPHSAAPLSEMSVAVNVFFRNLDNGYSQGRDVYGNRDLIAYEQGRRDVDKLVSRFSGLPADAKIFYLRRLADELAHLSGA